MPSIGMQQTQGMSVWKKPQRSKKCSLTNGRSGQKMLFLGGHISANISLSRCKEALEMGARCIALFLGAQVSRPSKEQ